jgi:hypothetical protein
MLYLIQESVVFAKGRNHGAYLAHAGTAPQGSSDTLYLWNMITHPTSGEAALEIPNPILIGSVDEEGNEIDGNVFQYEWDALVETLPADWTPTEEA